MIEDREIDERATRFGVGHAHIQRDHFVSHILAVLTNVDLDLRFYGGTALCRTYLEGRRLSEDIDLLHADPRAALDALEIQLPHGLRLEYPNAAWTGRGPEADGVIAFLATPAVDPIKLYIGCDGPNTAAWEFLTTEVHLRYSDLPSVATFLCPTLPTFAAMKLAAWYDRHAPRDLFDLAGLADHPGIVRHEVEALLRRKLRHGFIEAEMLRVPRATLDAWEPELAAQVGVLASADECLARTRAAFS